MMQERRAGNDRECALAFNTRERSSGLASTMRSRAIRANARQLFVIYENVGKMAIALSSLNHEGRKS
jgi:hypothetical protein